MRDKPFSLDPGAAMLLGLLIFTLRPQEMTALLTAAAVHEIGHWTCLKWMHVPVYGFTVAISGPVLHCGEASNCFGQMAAALSGPVAGIALWAALRAVWPMCAGLSLFLSLVNLLPIYPLDGGRAIRAVVRREGFLFCFGLASACAAVLVGLYAFSRGSGPGLLLFGVWLMLLACQGDKNDVK